MLKYLPVFFVILVATAAPAATYYVSSSQGSDTNDGLTTEKPWKSLELIYRKSQTKMFAPGDRILLRRGDSWNGQIGLNCGGGGGGTDAAPITIGAFGQGDAPELLGDSSGFEWSAVPGQSGVYRASLGAGGNVYGGYSNHTPLKPVPLAAAKLADPATRDPLLKTLTPESFTPLGGYTSEIFVKPLENRAPSAPETIVFRQSAVALLGCSHVIVRDLALRKFFFGVDLEGSDHIEVRGMQLTDLIAMGIYLKSGNSNVLVEGNTVERTGNDAIYVNKSAHNIVRGNTVSHITNEILGYPTSGDQSAIGLQESQDDLVENNSVAYSKGGIDYYYETGSKVRSNFLFHTNGLGSPHGTDLEVYDNIVNIDPPNYGNGATTINTGHGRINVHNNTIYGAVAYGLQDQTPAGNGPVVFRKNIVVAANDNALLVKFPTAVDSQQNCFFSPNTPTFHQGHPYRSLSEFQGATHLEQGSTYADPQFSAGTPGSQPSDFKLKASSPCAAAGPVSFPDVTRGTSTTSKP